MYDRMHCCESSVYFSERNSIYIVYFSGAKGLICVFIYKIAKWDDMRKVIKLTVIPPAREVMTLRSAICECRILPPNYAEIGRKSA